MDLLICAIVAADYVIGRFRKKFFGDDELLFVSRLIAYGCNHGAWVLNF